jgi:VCBS repeat-containing protein
MNEDADLPITLTGSDADGDALTWSIQTPPEHGSLSGTAPDLVYTPDDDYFGPDSFTIRANDGTLDSEPAVVSISINPLNDPPNAIDDQITVNKGATATTVNGGQTSLLDNDINVDGDVLQAKTTPLTFPSYGTLLLNANGTFSYTHNDSFTENDLFVYEVCDDAAPPLCDSATVTVQIDVGEKPEVIFSDGFEPPPDP